MPEAARVTFDKDVVNDCLVDLPVCDVDMGMQFDAITDLVRHLRMRLHAELGLPLQPQMAVMPRSCGLSWLKN